MRFIDGGTGSAQALGICKHVWRKINAVDNTGSGKREGEGVDVLDHHGRLESAKKAGPSTYLFSFVGSPLGKYFFSRPIPLLLMTRRPGFKSSSTMKRSIFFGGIFTYTIMNFKSPLRLRRANSRS